MKAATRTKRAPRASRGELQAVPGIGPSIASDLERIGVTRLAQLGRADPDELYARVNAAKGARQDRCLLYVFRCAVYYASRPVHEPAKLKWWNWKDTS
jgi:pathogenicity locus Cdd1 protein